MPLGPGYGGGGMGADLRRRRISTTFPWLASSQLAPTSLPHRAIFCAAPAFLALEQR